MFASLIRNGSIDDITAPNVSVSYWNVNYNSFNSSEKSNPLKPNETNKIAELNNPDLVLLRIFSFDNQTGLGDFVCWKNNKVIQSFPNTVTTNLTYYDNHADPTSIIKYPNNRTIVIPVNTSIQTDTNYTISIYDKVGNFVQISLIVQTTPNNLFTLSIIVFLTFLEYLVIFGPIIAVLVVAYYVWAKKKKERKANLRKSNSIKKSVSNSSREGKITRIESILDQIETIESDLKKEN